MELWAIPSFLRKRQDFCNLSQVAGLQTDGDRTGPFLRSTPMRFYQTQISEWKIEINGFKKLLKNA